MEGERGERIHSERGMCEQVSIHYTTVKVDTGKLNEALSRGEELCYVSC